jgi:hypothetical protein
MQFLVGHMDAALVGFFKQVDAAQKGAFAGARAADDADHVAGVGGERDPLEHLIGAKAFVDVFDLKLERSGGGHDVRPVAVFRHPKAGRCGKPVHRRSCLTRHLR